MFLYQTGHHLSVCNPFPLPHGVAGRLQKLQHSSPEIAGILLVSSNLQDRATVQSLLEPEYARVFLLIDAAEIVVDVADRLRMFDHGPLQEVGRTQIASFRIGGSKQIDR